MDGDREGSIDGRRIIVLLYLQRPYFDAWKRRRLLTQLIASPTMTVKQKFFLAAALMLILSTLLLIVFGENGLTDRQHLKSRYRDVVSENTAIAKENARLFRQIERLRNDPAYIESIARSELSMIGSNEVIVKPLNPISSDSVNHANDETGGGDGNR